MIGRVLVVAGLLAFGLGAQTTVVGGAGPGTSAGVIALFSACSGTKYLGADGACHSITGGAWGGISGTLSAQTDLQSALDLKAPLASPTFTGTVAIGTTVPGGAPASSLAIAGNYYGNGSGLVNVLGTGFNKSYFGWAAGTISNAACTSTTFVLLNAAIGDFLAPTWPALNTGVIGIMRISAEDQIEVRLCNLSGGSVTVASLVYGAAVIK